MCGQTLYCCVLQVLTDSSGMIAWLGSVRGGGGGGWISSEILHFLVEYLSSLFKSFCSYNVPVDAAALQT